MDDDPPVRSFDLDTNPIWARKHQAISMNIETTGEDNKNLTATQTSNKNPTVVSVTQQKGSTVSTTETNDHIATTKEDMLSAKK
eukprot:8811402-Ditylum_brightwellii.AAC.1